MILQPTNGSAFIAAKRLPDEYQEVEWIRAIDGFVETDIIANMRHASVCVDVTTIQSPSANGYLSGQGASAARPRFGIRVRPEGVADFYVNASSGSAIGATDIQIDIGYRTLMTHSVDLDSGLVVCGIGSNMQSFEYNPNTLANDSAYCLFSTASGSNRLKDSANLHGFMYVDPDGAQELKMCYRKYDGLIGAFNMATWTFLPGEGTFTKGNDIY